MGTSLRELSQRSVGQFPLSIPTSLALEGFFGIYPERPSNEQKDFSKQVDELWINLRTLYRNVLGALDKTVNKQTLDPRDVGAVIIEEMRVIDSVVAERTNSTVAVRFYYCTYDRLDSAFPKASLYVPKTDLQLFDKMHEGQSLTYVLSDPSVRDMVGKTRWEVTPKMFDAPPKRVALLSSYPLDLVKRYEFTELYLLESHTGKVKGNALFYTKLKTKPDGVTLPFSVFTLQIFGDNGRIFDPNPKALREMVSGIAKQDGWTWATTRDRIRSSITRHHDKPAVQALLNMLGS